MQSFRISILFTLFLITCVGQLFGFKIVKNEFRQNIMAEENETIAKGYLFNDKNKNGTRDEGEDGIEGVAVSNGLDVVFSNNEGYYSLPINDDAIIFYVKPANWISPVNKNNIPQFFYVHKPNGSPSHFEFKGVSPTGELPDEINFPLYQSNEKSEFKIIIFGDPQPYSLEDVDFVAEDIVKELVNQNGFEFGITMGDIVGDNLNLFNPLNRVISKIGIPWYYVLGNHDMNFDAESDELSDETYERVYGPPTYAFIYGDVHFIVIDDVIHFRDGDKARYVGGLREDQLKFIENYLKTVPKDKLIVLNMHIPFALRGDWFRTDDQKKLFSLLKDFPNTLSISAHSHTQNNGYFHKDSTDWLGEVPHHHYNAGTTSGSWWSGMRNENNIPHTMMRDGTPNGYAFITFSGSKYIIDWKVAGSSEEHRMNIHIPRGLTEATLDSAKVVVNYFMGCEQTVVEHRIKNYSDWQPMIKKSMIDPFYEELTTRWEFMKKYELYEKWKNDSDFSEKPFPGKNIPKKQKSSHIWVADLDKNLNPGEYVIEVRVKDRYGRTFNDYQLFRISEELKK